MQENVRLFELQIKGANSVKELKEQIGLLRDRLVQLDNTSEDYKDTVQDLIEGEKKLKEVMSASKEAISGANGSYNSLVNEMGSLKKVWREVTSEAERAKIGARISEINEELKRMDATIGNNQRKVGSYEEALKKAFMTPQQELKKLKVELAGMEQGSAEYNATFKRMAELTHEVTEQQEMLKWSSSDLGDILGNLAGVAQGVAGGFSAVNAITGLIAGGNEDVEKAMLNTQRWMQLIQGLGALEELGDRIKGLWTGIENYNDKQEISISAMKDFADTTEMTGETIEGTTQSIAKQSTIIKQTTTDVINLAEGMKLLKEEELKELETLNQKLNVINQNIVARTHAIADVEAMIEAEIISREEGEKSIKVHKQILEVDKQTYNEIEKRIKQIKKQTDANKRLREEEKKLGTSTSWLGKQIDLLNGKFLAMQDSSNAVVRGFGKIGAGAITLGKTFWTALISTGIGALIVLLGTLLSAMWKYIDGSAKAEKATEKLKKAQENLNESLAKQEKAWEREEKLLQAQGKSYDEIYEARKKNLQAQLAEVRANLAIQQAIAKEIGKRRLQKEKYAEFRDTLKELVKQEKELATQIEDLDYDKYIEGVKKATEVQKKKAEADKKAWEERKKQLDEEKKKAKELYESLRDYYKSDLQKLTAKYKEEYKLLSKMNADKKTIAKAQALLTQKYNIDVNNLTLTATKEIWDRIRANNNKNIQALGTENKAYYEAQIEEAERYRDSLSATLANINRGSNESEEFAYLNAFEGTDIKNISEFNTEMAIAENRVKDAHKALLEFQSTNIMTKLGKDYEKLGNEASVALNRFEMNVEKLASESYKGFYSGLSPKQLKEQLEERYKLQYSYLNMELELYKEVLKQKNLTDEDRAQVQSNMYATQIAMQDLLTQKTIDSNYLMIESYNNMSNSIQGISSSLTDIMGSVSDMIMNNAEAQLKAGEITEEEYNRQFEKSKAIQIAQATINTIAGAVGAFMGITRDTGGWGIALAIAQATAVLASGMAQIQQIKNTTPSSSGSGSGNSGGRYAEVTPDATSDYRPDLVQNATSQQETENLANAIGGMNLWVSVSDIDNAQNKGKVRVAESTF